MKSIRKFGIVLPVIILSLMLLSGCESQKKDSVTPTPTAAAGTTSAPDNVTKVPEDLTNAPDNATATPTETTPDTERFPNRANADTQSGTAKELEAGDVAPEFTLTFQDGSTFRLSDYDDGVVLLNFWATWCGPCVREMPDLQKLYKEALPGVTVRCISIGDPDENTVKQFVEDSGYDPGFIGYAYGTHISDYYPSDYIPYTVIIVKGIVRETIVGSNSYDYYKELLTRYAAE